MSVVGKMEDNNQAGEWEMLILPLKLLGVIFSYFCHD